MKAKSTKTKNKKSRQSQTQAENNKHMKKYKTYWYIVEATQIPNKVEKPKSTKEVCCS